MLNRKVIFVKVLFLLIRVCVHLFILFISHRDSLA